jgi:CRISPR-associated protein Csm4
MPSFLACPLRFRSPLHVGRRGVGLEATRAYVPADTLFSALCSVWRELYGAEHLRTEVLDRFNAGRGPFYLTSAFPTAAGARFYPKPLVRRQLQLAAQAEKTWKRLRFVSEGILRGLLAGEPLTFRKEDCVNGETAWTTPEERRQLDRWTDDETGDIVLWRTAVVPRVTLDRVSSASEIWHFGRTCLAEGAGLWFGVVFPAAGADQTVQRFFMGSLRLLGDTGLGGERSAGHGLFQLGETGQVDLPDHPDSGCFVTLAPVCPRDAGEAAALTGEGAAYELLPRRGWVTSPEGRNLRRKTVWMLAEGSVLTGTGVLRPGRLVDVTPDVLGAHRVYRYGFAFPIGVNR